MSTLLMKFGGSSVGTTAALTQMLSIVLYERARWDNILLVASALEGVTDMLLESAQLAQLDNQRGYQRITATLRTRHLALVEQLPLDSTEQHALQVNIDRLLFEMLNRCRELASTPNDTLTSAVSDAIVSVGERLSARIIASLLHQNNLRGVAIDTTDLIVTDNVYGYAAPNIDLTRQKIEQQVIPLLKQNIIPVATGFIGATPEGNITTLGRGGSDYTASILSACIDMDEVWMWTDVDGIMSADPREFPDAELIEEFSYTEIAELAHFGARILHPKMINPLRDQGIALRIKNIYKPQQAGTLITNTVSDQKPQIKSVTSIQGLGLVAKYNHPLTEVINLVDSTFFSMIGGGADVMITSQSASHSFLCFVISTAAGTNIIENLRISLENQLIEDDSPSPWQIKPVSVVTTVGNNFHQQPNLTTSVLQAISDVPFLGLALGPSQYSISIVVSPEDRLRVVQQIHSKILKND